MNLAALILAALAAGFGAGWYMRGRPARPVIRVLQLGRRFEYGNAGEN